MLIKIEVMEPPKLVPPNAAVSNMNATSESIPNVSGINNASVTVPPSPGRIPISNPSNTPRTIRPKLDGFVTVLTAVRNASPRPGACHVTPGMRIFPGITGSMGVDYKQRG